MRIYVILLIMFALTLQGFGSSSMAMNDHLVSQKKYHRLLITQFDNALVQESVSITPYTSRDNEQAISCCCSEYSSCIKNTLKSRQQCEHECDHCDHCDRWHSPAAVLISCYFEFNQSKSESILDRTLDSSSTLLTGLAPPP